MSRKRLVLLAAAAAVPCCLFGNAAHAQFASIRTNAGGADAELRESETNVVGNLTLGTNRGTSNELATRAIDRVIVDSTQTPPVITNPFPADDRSSIGMVKFDISSLPNHTTSGFWTPEAKVQFRLYVRNANNVNNLFGANPSDPNEEVNLRFRVRALDPTKVYADDNPSAANRTDRVGNSYVASEYRYNWNENAVTFYNAPGITPHRVDASTGNVVETLGLYDDFNSDTLSLGTITLRDFLPTGQSALPQGSAVIFDDDSLKQLVFDAQDAGRQHITLFFHIDNVTTSHQPTVGINGVTPAGMLNRNYLFVPKEHLTLSSTLSNANGDFSPELRVVPEPSAGLAVAGLAAVAAGIRRRRTC